MIDYIIKKALGIPREGVYERVMEFIDRAPGKMYDSLTRPLADYVVKKAIGIKR